MTIEKIKKMAKGIYNMHGLEGGRERQIFFFNGMIYYYDMQQAYMLEKGHIIRVFVVNFKDTENTACEIVFKADGTIKSVSKYNNFRTTLKAPVKRSF